jgi:hypothetical protein
MAKGKKSSGKHYVSKGERPNVKRSTLLDLIATPFKKLCTNRIRRVRRGSEGRASR